MSPLKLTLDHGGASVSNLAGSIGFYQSVLGFVVDESFQIPGTDVSGVVMSNTGGARVELFHRPQSRPASPGHPVDSTLQQGWFQLAFRVADLAQVFQQVVACGATIVKPPFRGPDGRAQVAFIADPDGNLIELIERGAIRNG